MKVVSVLLLVIFLSSCAANGPRYQEHIAKSSDVSIVYIYRPSKMVNCCVAPAVYINGEKKHSLKNGGYLVYELVPGENEVTVGDGSYGFESQIVSMELKPGSSYYLKWVIGSLEKFDVTVIGGYAGVYSERNYHLIEMPVVSALKEIASLKLSH